MLPRFRCFPGAGACAITCPFGTFFEAALVTCPTAQRAARMAAFAAASAFPFTLGTTQRACGGFAAKPAVTDVSESTVTVHVPVPEQPPPDHPLNDEPGPGDAVSVTVDP